MKLRWSASAVARLDAIHNYIASDNPAAAQRLVRQIVRRAGQIAVFPGSGRRVADYDRDEVRELIEGDYRLIYRIHGDHIDVLAVMHGAQLLPNDLDAL